MTDFLLELRSEEIPARMQDKARDDLTRLFNAELDKAGLSAGEIVTYATPRRLALIARDLPLETQAVREETKGPKISAPAQALEGFLRKTGLTQDQLEDRDGIWFAVVEKPGRFTAQVLAEAIPAIVRAFPWPKSMRWGAASASTESMRWVRPLQGIVAVLGEDAVPCEVDGIVSGYQTLGHRFHHPGGITIGGAHDYVEKLRACHVIVDQEERRALIREGADRAARDAGLALVPDEGLVSENAGLTEWPVPMLGRFDPDFLAVPEEVIQLTARVNQKYFICRDAGGKLAPAFVCTANIDANDGGAAVIAGNEKVLAARLSDAKFFWEQDLKVPLEKQAEKLSQIVFHEKLGTIRYRVDRTSGLAIWMLNRGYLSGFSENDAERSALLAKADLVTGTVGEFPELQAIVGSRIAAFYGASPETVLAIRDQYRPVGPSDNVPTDPLAIALALADKLQSICGFFSEGLSPTGSSDPFALRRTALGIIRIILENGLRLPLALVIYVEMTSLFFAEVRLFAENEHVEADTLIDQVREFVWNEKAASEKIRDKRFAMLLESVVPKAETAKAAAAKLMLFLADRLKVQQREAGVRHDLIDAVFSLGGEDDLVRLLARVKALQSFIEVAEGANLLAAYKRAANILKAENPPRLRGGGGEADGGGAVPHADGGELDTPLHRSAVPLPTSGEDLASPMLDEGTKAPMAAGKEQQIPQTGEEDPFVEVDQGLRKAIAANPGRTEGTIPEGAEAADIALLGALDIAQSEAKIAVDEERFGEAMAALAKLRQPIDRFFDEVMVNDADSQKRAFRLGLLARFRDAVHAVADFSKIEG